MKPEQQEAARAAREEEGNFPTSAERLASHREKKAEQAVEEMFEEEADRRMWSIECVLDATNLEVTEKNMIELADKVYEYVWGKKQI